MNYNSGAYCKHKVFRGAHAVVVRVALLSTLPFIAATTASLVEPFGISSLPESAYSLKVVVLPFAGPR